MDVSENKSIESIGLTKPIRGEILTIQIQFHHRRVTDNIDAV